MYESKNKLSQTPPIGLSQYFSQIYLFEETKI